MRRDDREQLIPILDETFQAFERTLDRDRARCTGVCGDGNRIRVTHQAKVGGEHGNLHPGGGP